MVRWKIRLIALGACCGLLSVAEPARAYCRTTTCDPRDPTQNCERDSDGCIVTGIPLQWAQACVTFSVHARGSPLRGISYASAVEVIARAFADWTQADCNGGFPSLAISATAEPATCGEPEYNPAGGNANVWTFRDENWPYAERALAVTTVTFDGETGELLNADVQINTGGAELTLGGDGEGYDLASVVEHEVGHFVGLSHSPLRDATMWDRTRPGSIEARSLEPDDRAGVCAAYPPDRPQGVCDFTPRHGWSPDCAEDDASCSAVGRTQKRLRGSPLLFAFALLVVRRRGARAASVSGARMRGR